MVALASCGPAHSPFPEPDKPPPLLPDLSDDPEVGSTRTFRVVNRIDTVPDLTKPTVDLPYWYANAQLGPMNDPCATLQFDTDSTMNGRAQSLLSMTTSARDLGFSLSRWYRMPEA